MLEHLQFLTRYKTTKQGKELHVCAETLEENQNETLDHIVGQSKFYLCLVSCERSNFAQCRWNRDVIIFLLFNNLGLDVQHFIMTTRVEVLVLRIIVLCKEGPSGPMVSVLDCTSSSLVLSQWLGSALCS